MQSTISRRPSDESPSRIIFPMDKSSKLFPTYEAENMWLFDNRVSLHEIHEVLVKVNDKLMPLTRLFNGITVFAKLALLTTLTLSIILSLLYLKNELIISLVCSFALLQLWVFGAPIARKRAFQKTIQKVLEDFRELYNNKGLKWRLKSSCFWRSLDTPCWMELLVSEEDTIDGSEDQDMPYPPNTENVKIDVPLPSTNRNKTSYETLSVERPGLGLNFHIDGRLFTVIEVHSEASYCTNKSCV